MQKNSHIGDQLLTAYLLGETDEHQSKTVELWLNEKPENQLYFDDFAKVWELTSIITDKPIEVDVKKAWEKVESKINLKPEIWLLKRNIFPYSIGIAATVLIFAFLFIFYQKNIHKPIIVQTLSKQQITDTIADGSVITLNNSSTITYNKTFNKKSRNIKLSGEAYFEVTKNKQKPFIVDVDYAQIEVVGTKFNVNTRYSNTQMSVFVEQGSVKITTNNQNTMILGAGEKGFIYKSTGKTEKIELNVENQNDLYWKNKTLNFEGDNLSDVIETLKKSYNIEIEIDPKITNLKLSASFENESLDEVLNILSMTFNLNITKNGNKYLIHAQ